MSDLDRLQGSWRQTEGDDDYGAGLCTFAGDRFTVRDHDGAVMLEGTFVLDEGATPRQVDWTDATGPDAGTVLPAIYELTDTTLVFVAANADMPRPTAFRAGDGEVLRRFVRIG